MMSLLTKFGGWRRKTGGCGPELANQRFDGPWEKMVKW